MFFNTHIESKKKNAMIIAALIFIIILGVLRFCYAFYVQKQDFHSDETWSYGLANSYYEPYLYTDADEQYNKNICFWTSGDILHDYLTVQPEQRFSYASTYYNLSKDLHPPLYFFILHTICSIFPDTFSYTYGFIINIFSFIVMSIFLFKTIKLATDSDKAGLLGVIFNTFMTGCVSIIAFVRMYAMSAMFSVMLTYYLFRIYKEYKHSEKVKNSSYIGAAVVTLLGALTHHFFLVYAFMLTLIFTIYYLINKAWKVFAKLAAFMLGSVAVSIALFPATIDHLFINGKAANASASTRIFDFKYQLSALFMHFDKEIFGFSWIVPYKRPVFAYILVILIILAFLFAGCFFLFRREEWFSKSVTKIKTEAKRLFKLALRPNVMHIALLVSIIFVIMVCAKIVNYSDMLNYSDRYMFVIFPIAVIFVIITTHSLFTVLKLKKHLRYSLMAIFVLFTLIMSNVRVTSPYLKLKLEQYGTTLDDIAEENSDVLILSTATWLLTSYSERLLGANSYFYTIASADYLIALEESIESLDSDKPLYLVLDITITDVKNIDVDPDPNKTFVYQSEADDETSKNNSNSYYKDYINTVLEARNESRVPEENRLELYDYLSYINDLSICKKLTFVGYDTVFTRPVLIYKLN